LYYIYNRPMILFCRYRKPRVDPWMNALSKITIAKRNNFGQRFSVVVVSTTGMPVGIYSYWLYWSY